MALPPPVLARIEAMLDRGQVYGAPEMLSATDRTLDALPPRSPVATAPKPRSSAENAPVRPEHAPPVNWLDLPSLAELMRMRKRLFQDDRPWLAFDAISTRSES
jgi:hypothetical protein